MLNTFRFLIIALVLAVGLPPFSRQHITALAASKKEDPVAYLLHLPDRPLPSDFVRVFGGWPQENPFLGISNREYKQALKTELPRLIALLERAYPGATWAPLGRDAIGMGMALDAFYVSIGQTGRVSPLRASSGSFYGGVSRQVSDASLARFIESAGFDFKNVDQSPPLILFDNTSFSVGSQSTRVIGAGYREYARRGGKPTDLIQKLNAISSSSGIPLNVKDANTQLENYFAKQKNWVLSGRNQQGTYQSMPSEILYLTMPTLYQYLMYGNNMWHQGYGGFRLGPDGRFEGEPGALEPLESRQEMLYQTWVTYEIVRTSQFLKAVQREAARLGYEFPLERRYEAIQIDPNWRMNHAQESLREAQESLRELVEGLGPKPEGKQKYFSEHAQLLANWLTAYTSPEAPNNQMVLLFIYGAIDARERGSIGDRDIRRLIANAIGSSNVEDEAFLNTLSKMVQENARLRMIFIEKAWGFLTPTTQGHEVIAPKFQVIVQKVLEPLKCELILTKPEESKPDQNAEALWRAPWAGA